MTAGRNVTMRYDVLAGHILADTGRLGACRLVAVDGPSGAGKSYFAHRLAQGVGECGARAEVVHTDDLLDGWSDQLTFWSRLEDCVLEPLRAGKNGGFNAYDWHSGRRSDSWTPVTAAPVVIIEGVSTSRAEARKDLSFSVFVAAPLEVRRRRAIERDGEDLAPFMDRWRLVEDEFFGREQALDHAEMVVDGNPMAIPHNADTEFVILTSRFDSVR